MSAFEPTAEQEAALALFEKGESMVIEAGAGTGKTSTLRLLAEHTAKRGRYVAFNKAIVEDVKGSMPEHIACNTAHSLAFAAVGKRYAHRLRSQRQRSSEIAERLKIAGKPFVIRYGTQAKVLQPGFLAGWIMRGIGNFCHSADEEPGRQHLPYLDGIDLPDEKTGKRTWKHNDAVRDAYEDALFTAWADICSLDGQLRFSHDCYLKLWQLSHPRIPAELILYDECQDADPVMDAVVAEQAHAQRVYVGDANQAIYEWRGAVNAIERMKASGLACAQLSQSFRFGPAIAERANEELLELGSELMLRGTESIPSECGPLDGDPDAVLCRMNATAITQALDFQRRGLAPHVVGGGKEVLSFAEGAEKLQQTGWSPHPELACFESWGEVLDYVQHDELGGELALMVRLVEEFGVATIKQALRNMAPESHADVIVSTAHKAKGREWDRVKIAADFAPSESRGMDDAELRLRYVAITRAKRFLDAEALDAKAEKEPAA